MRRNLHNIQLFREHEVLISIEANIQRSFFCLSLVSDVASDVCPLFKDAELKVVV